MFARRAIPAVSGAAVLVGGCVIPVPLERDEGDAGPSSPPVILSAAPDELAFPGPIVLQAGVPTAMQLSIRDRDISDTLFVKFFVDYGITNQEKERADCKVTQTTNSEVRLQECTLGSVCNAELADDQDHFMEAMVSDREFLFDNDPRVQGQPPFRAVPPDAAVSFRAWILRCAPEAAN